MPLVFYFASASISSGDAVPVTPIFLTVTPDASDANSAAVLKSAFAANAAEKAEIQRLWQPYFEQLPEYEYLREILTSEWP